jgi:hypothetical protein
VEELGYKIINPIGTNYDEEMHWDQFAANAEKSLSFKTHDLQKSRIMAMLLVQRCRYCWIIYWNFTMNISIEVEFGTQFGNCKYENGKVIFIKSVGLKTPFRR